MAWVDGLHIGSVVGPEAKQKIQGTRTGTVLCSGVGTRHGRAGQDRAGQVRTPTPYPPVPCPLAPALHPCQQLVWEGSQGVPRAAQCSRGRLVARMLAWDRRGGVEAIDGTDQGPFARDGCPALGPRLASASAHPRPKANSARRPSHSSSSCPACGLWHSLTHSPDGLPVTPHPRCRAQRLWVLGWPCGLWTHINCRLLTKIGVACV